MAISNVSQRVDAAKYGESYDRIFGKKSDDAVEVASRIKYQTEFTIGGWYDRWKQR